MLNKAGPYSIEKFVWVWNIIICILVDSPIPGIMTEVCVLWVHMSEVCLQDEEGYGYTCEIRPVQILALVCVNSKL